jgi:hypothetical protein
MATIKLEAPASQASILTTELNSLADGGNKTSSALSNDAAGELYLYADFELYIAAQGSNRADDARVDLYILVEQDASNYTYGGDSLDPPDNAYVGTFLFDVATAARYNHIRGIPLPPTDFKVLLINETGQAFASSGNTLKWIKYNLQSS